MTALTGPLGKSAATRMNGALTAVKSQVEGAIRGSLAKPLIAESPTRIQTVSEQVLPLADQPKGDIGRATATQVALRNVYGAMGSQLSALDLNEVLKNSRRRVRVENEVETLCRPGSYSDTAFDRLSVRARAGQEAWFETADKREIMLVYLPDEDRIAAVVPEGRHFIEMTLRGAPIESARVIYRDVKTRQFYTTRTRGLAGGARTLDLAALAERHTVKAMQGFATELALWESKNDSALAAARRLSPASKVDALFTFDKTAVEARFECGTGVCSARNILLQAAKESPFFARLLDQAYVRLDRRIPRLRGALGTLPIAATNVKVVILGRPKALADTITLLDQSECARLFYPSTFSRVRMTPARMIVHEATHHLTGLGDTGLRLSKDRGPVVYATDLVLSQMSTAHERPVPPRAMYQSTSREIDSPTGFESASLAREPGASQPAMRMPDEETAEAIRARQATLEWKSAMLEVALWSANEDAALDAILLADRTYPKSMRILNVAARDRQTVRQAAAIRELYRRMNRTRAESIFSIVEYLRRAARAALPDRPTGAAQAPVNADYFELIEHLLSNHETLRQLASKWMRKPESVKWKIDLPVLHDTPSGVAPLTPYHLDRSQRRLTVDARPIYVFGQTNAVRLDDRTRSLCALLELFLSDHPAFSESEIIDPATNRGGIIWLAEELSAKAGEIVDRRVNAQYTRDPNTLHEVQTALRRVAADEDGYIDTHYPASSNNVARYRW